jgi:hypothetical protein
VACIDPVITDTEIGDDFEIGSASRNDGPTKLPPSAGEAATPGWFPSSHRSARPDRIGLSGSAGSFHHRDSDLDAMGRDKNGDRRQISGH